MNSFERLVAVLGVGLSMLAFAAPVPEAQPSPPPLPPPTSDAPGLPPEPPGLAPAPAPVPVPAPAVVQEPVHTDPARSRYFFTSSALRMKAGEVAFSQRELLFSEVSLGITDNLSATVGSAIPIDFSNSNGTSLANLTAGLTAGISLNENVHLAAGADALVFPSVGTLGFVFGIVTLGTEKLNLSVSGGAPFALAQGQNSVGNLVILASAGVELGQHFGLLTENWFFPLASASNGSTSLFTLDMFGVRFRSTDLAADVGFLYVTGPLVNQNIPLPWVNFTYRWENVFGNGGAPK